LPLGPWTASANRPVPIITPLRPLQSSPPGESEASISNVGRWEPMSTLVHDFRFNTTFCEKVRKLEELGFNGWRRIRGDGNCFYRAVGFGLLEQLLAVEGPCRAEWGTAFHSRLKKARLEDVSERKAHAHLMAFVEQLCSGGGWEALLPSDADDMLCMCLCEPNCTLDLALVRALRHLLAQFLIEHAHDPTLGHGIDFYTICNAQGYADVADFCKKVVLPMGAEADGAITDIMPKALGIGMSIAFLDRRDIVLKVFTYELDDVKVTKDNRGSAFSDFKKPIIHLQLRPGHYDMLYYGAVANKEQEVKVPETQCQPSERKQQPLCYHGRRQRSGWCL